jgi:uncharacterized lipoprotein NlpE involved in copper resistance
MKTTRYHKPLAVLALTAATFSLTGCNNALEGGVTGGALGGLAGFGIGSAFGDAGKGAAIGAISGAVFGGVQGDQNRRNAGGGYHGGY